MEKESDFVCMGVVGLDPTSYSTSETGVNVIFAPNLCLPTDWRTDSLLATIVMLRI